MKLVFISDTHNMHLRIPDVGGGDIIFHTGDISGRGYEYEIEDFIQWYGELDFSHRVLVPGNHDFGFESDYAKYKTMCDEAGIILLNDSGITIDGIKIWGSPMSPWFHNWAFNRGRNDNECALYGVDPIKPHWDMIPEDTDILLTHGPVYGILDELVFVGGTPKGQFVGCVDLRNRIRGLNLKIHSCGHIHEGYGTYIQDGVLHINASSLDQCYSPGNEPIKVKWVNGKAELL